MRASVVIPALDEEEKLPTTLALLLSESSREDVEVEVIVADGGSRDRTVAIAREHGALVVVAPAGRASQMNAGAKATSGDPIFFLHADTRLTPAHLRAANVALQNPAVTHGSFAIRFDEEGIGLSLVRAAANLRTLLDRTPYGDQALFVRRRAFDRVGGFPPVPILEEVILARELGRGGKFAFLRRTTVVTSARRWREQGMMRTTACNVIVRLLWELGVAPHRLARLRTGSSSCRRPSVPQPDQS